MPSAIAAIRMRLKLKLTIAILKAPCSGPIRRAAGTRQSSNTIWQVASPCMPRSRSLRPRFTPGLSPSTIRQLMPRCPGVAVGLGEHEDQVGDLPQADPCLGAVDDVVVAIARRDGLDASNVRAVVGLADAGGGNRAPARTSAIQPWCIAVAVREEQRTASTGIASMLPTLPEQRASSSMASARRNRVESAAARRLGQRRAEKAEARPPPVDVVGESSSRSMPRPPAGWSRSAGTCARFHAAYCLLTRYGSCSHSSDLDSGVAGVYPVQSLARWPACATSSVSRSRK